MEKKLIAKNPNAHDNYDIKSTIEALLAKQEKDEEDKKNKK